MIEFGTLLQDRYLIERQIGEGGMGAVYAAIDQRFGSQVAIKETFYKHDELGVAFEREAHLLNSLHHPALPHVSDYFAENNGYFLVMQFIEGEDLSEILRREGAFPVKDVLHWTDDLLDALDYLHSQEPPIIHRDIKPQNLKITARGDVILLDFGLAKLNSEDSSVEKSIFGYSRKYSPLEQIQGTGTDARSDIFSLGATAYHLLTGKPPLEVIARASEIIHGNPDPLRLASDINSEIPVAVADVLNKALALNAVRRFASAKEMREALDHAVNLAPIEAAEELPTPIPAVVFLDNNTAADAVDNDFVNSDEIENFTALEAFAADTANNLPQINAGEKSGAVGTSISELVNYLPAPQVVQKESHVGDLTTKVVPRTKETQRFRVAALAALVVCSVWGALYFIARTNSSAEANQAPAVQAATETNSSVEQSAVVQDEPLPEIADAPLLETAEQVKTKSPSFKKTVVKKETDDDSTAQIEATEKVEPTEKVEAREKTKVVPPASDISRSIPTKKSRRNEPQPRNHTRPRVAEPESAPDIESIFTGRSSGRANQTEQRREERRRQREEMSDEELRELRRQRRQTRRQRQNGSTFPF
jgi:serine/threonine protein kinase